MTPNKEDYLKCIYEIGIDLHKITNAVGSFSFILCY